MATHKFEHAQYTSKESIKTLLVNQLQIVFCDQGIKEVTFFKDNVFLTMPGSQHP